MHPIDLPIDLSMPLELLLARSRAALSWFAQLGGILGLS